MSSQELLLRIIECETDIAGLEGRIEGLKESLKAAKKALTDKQAERRGLIMDAHRPMFQLLDADGEQAAEAH